MINYIAEFIDAKSVEKGASFNTLQAYNSDLKQLEEFFTQKNIHRLQLADIEKYIIYLSNNGNIAKTISRKISSIREFYKFLQSESIIHENPVNKLSLPKIGKHLPWFLTHKEIMKMCQVAKKSKRYSFRRIGVMINLMYSSGLRVSELVSLQEGAINYDLQQIHIRGKGGKERIVPVSKNVISEIFEYLKYRDNFTKNKNNIYLFPSLLSISGHVTRDGFYKSLKKIALLAKIPSNKVHPHVLRHSFATKLVNNSVDLRSIQKMLGHENVVTTEIYTHITSQKLSDEVRKHHPLSQIDFNKLKKS